MWILFRKPTNEKRDQLWANLLLGLKHKNLGPGSVRVDDDAADYLEYDKDVRSLDWNVLEMRNTLETAVSLARAQIFKDRGSSFTDQDTVIVRESHLRQVVSMSRSFRGYMEEVSGGSDAERALQMGERHDRFIEEAEKNRLAKAGRARRPDQAKVAAETTDGVRPKRAGDVNSECG